MGQTRWRIVALLASCCVVATASTTFGAAARPAAPPPLSRETTPSNLDSSYGSGSFGQWGVDAFGLPVYHYKTDEATAAKAKQPELAGGTLAQHQIGNDHIKGMAFNDGYTQFWSQDRLSQWANLYDGSSQHYGGGFGWLDTGGTTASTFYLDRAKDSHFTREFGVGYYRRTMQTQGVDVSEQTYAPFGNDPVLVDDVTLRNTTESTKHASWFEYWDVNPYDQSTGFQRNIGMQSPVWDDKTHTLSVQQFAIDDADTAPLSIFAAAVHGPVTKFDTSVSSFFGSGTRAKPAAVAAGQLGDTIANPSPSGRAGDTMFAFQSPVVVRPGQAVTLRYVYGMAHAADVPALVSRYHQATDPLGASERAWAQWLPKVDLGPSRRWVSRELVWDAYLLRSATVYEELCGEHTITQGGYYQYQDGANLGYRSWLHYLLPMVYTDPDLARQILRYAIQLQPAGTAQNAQLPYGTGQLCARVDLGTSNDLDFWLLLAAAEYGLGSRDTHFFDEQIPYYETGTTATAWQHIKTAFEHQESLLGPHGDYIMGSTGDWSDFSTEFEQMTESTLVTAQLAYAYPQLAQLADLRGDHTFAAQLRAAGARNVATLRREWTGGGWYGRGWSGNRQVGSGVIFGEPQPWAILAGAPSNAQAQTLVANIRRYLDGVGAPAVVHGPARIGSTIVPARDDPGVTERGPTPLDSTGLTPDVVGAALPNSPWQNAADWPGGVWFDVNGWLTWALADLQGVVPDADNLAWSEYIRNTLATHATVYPNHWAGTISVDDVCYGYYSAHPADCGNGLTTAYDGQITEQPTWMVMDAIRLAGVTPTEHGFDITPHFPFPTFSLRLPDVGVAQAPGLLRGYVRPVQGGDLEMQVTVPASASNSVLRAWADGRPVSVQRSGSQATFTLPTSAGIAADWALTWTRSNG